MGDRRGRQGQRRIRRGHLEIDPRLVETALRYYGTYREEIDDWIERVHALNEREESTWRAAQEAISA